MMLSKNSRVSCISTALFLFAISVSYADDARQRIDQTIEAVVRPLLDQHDIPGMAIALTIDGKQYFYNFGFASKESKQPVTKDTIFELGSISKAFTATLASYAQTTGTLSLSDKASKYLPSLQGSAFDEISLLELGTYTAGGLPLQFPADVKDGEAMIDYFRNWKPTFAAGTHRLYSNPSIGLFGFLAAASMDKPFDDVMEKALLPKLQLSHTYVTVPEAEMRNYAWGYSKDGKPIRVNPGVLDSEAYGIKSSAADLIQFVEANMHGGTLDETLNRAIAATQTGYFKVGEMTQGLGWELYPYPVEIGRLLAGNSRQVVLEANEVTPLVPPMPPHENMLINKTGSTNGFSAYVVFVPAKRWGIVMLANKNYPNAARVQAAYEILTKLESSAAP
jgi:beta-lactamase class C